MNDISLDKIDSILAPPVKPSQGTAEKGESFGKILSDSIGNVNRLQLEADQAIQDMVAGKGRGIHETMIAIQKAEVSFQLMMEIRNKIVAAYEQIMRMGA